MRVWILCAHDCAPPEKHWYWNRFWCAYCGFEATPFVREVLPRSPRKARAEKRGGKR